MEQNDVLKGQKILLAEDNASNRMVAREMLQLLGAIVVEAQDGQDALDMLTASAPDILMLDIEMPRVSGLDVLRMLKDVPKRPVIIALTGHVGQDHVARILELGADGVIGKPIGSLSGFANRLESILSRAVKIDIDAQGGDAVLVDMSVFGPLCEAMGPDMTCQLLSRVEEDLQVALGRISDAVKDKKLTDIRAQSHILVGVAGAVGGKRLQSLGESLNSAAHESDWATIHAELTVLALEAHALMRALDTARPVDN